MRYGSASGLDRSLKCRGSMSLPRVRRASSEAASRGTVLHKFMADVSVLGRDKALALVTDELRQVAAEIDVDALPTKLTAEVAFAYSTITGTARVLGVNLERQYDITEHEIPGTADVIGLIGENTVYVGDWKFGASWQPPPRDNTAVMFYALCACLAYNRTKAIVEVVKIRDTVYRQRDEFTYEQLGWLVKSRIDAMAKRVDSGERPLDVVEGDHCHFCESWVHCPAKTSLMFAEDPNATPLDAYLRSKDVTKYAETLAEQVRGWAEREPIALPDGRTYCKRPMTFELWDPRVVREVVGEIHGILAADACVAVTEKTSREKVKSGLSYFVSPEHLEVATKDVLKAIEASGGLSKSTQYQYRVGKRLDV